MFKALMVRPSNEKAEEDANSHCWRKDKTYRSLDHSAKELSISKDHLNHAIEGGISRSETNQFLATQAEKALEWIRTSTAAGNPVQRESAHEMAEKLIKQRFPEGQVVPQIGPTWVPSFPHCHRYLKTKMTCAVVSKILLKNKSFISMRNSVASFENTIFAWKIFSMLMKQVLSISNTVNYRSLYICNKLSFPRWDLQFQHR